MMKSPRRNLQRGLSIPNEKRKKKDDEPKYDPKRASKAAKALSAEGRGSLDSDGGSIFALCTKSVKTTEKYYFISLDGMRGRLSFSEIYVKRILF